MRLINPHIIRTVLKSFLWILVFTGSFAAWADKDKDAYERVLREYNTNTAFREYADELIEGLKAQIVQNEEAIKAGNANETNYVVDFRYEGIKKIHPMTTTKDRVNGMLKTFNNPAEPGDEIIAFYTLLSSAQNPALYSMFQGVLKDYYGRPLTGDYSEFQEFLKHVAEIDPGLVAKGTYEEADNNSWHEDPAKQKYYQDLFNKYYDSYNTHLDAFNDLLWEKAALGSATQKGLLLNYRCQTKYYPQKKTHYLNYDPIIAMGQRLRASSIRLALRNYANITYSQKLVEQHGAGSSKTKAEAGLILAVKDISEMLERFRLDPDEFTMDEDGLSAEARMYKYIMTQKPYEDIYSYINERGPNLTPPQAKVNSSKIPGSLGLATKERLHLLDYTKLIQFDGSNFFSSIWDNYGDLGGLSLRELFTKAKNTPIEYFIFITSDSKKTDEELTAVQIVEQIRVGKRSFPTYPNSHIFVMGLHLYTDDAGSDFSIPAQVVTYASDDLRKAMNNARKEASIEVEVPGKNYGYYRGSRVVNYYQTGFWQRYWAQETVYNILNKFDETDKDELLELLEDMDLSSMDYELSLGLIDYILAFNWVDGAEEEILNKLIKGMTTLNWVEFETDLPKVSTKDNDGVTRFQKLIVSIDGDNYWELLDIILDQYWSTAFKNRSPNRPFNWDNFRTIYRHPDMHALGLTYKKNYPEFKRKVLEQFDKDAYEQLKQELDKASPRFDVVDSYLSMYFYSAQTKQKLEWAYREKALNLFATKWDFWDADEETEIKELIASTPQEQCNNLIDYLAKGPKCQYGEVFDRFSDIMLDNDQKLKEMAMILFEKVVASDYAKEAKATATESLKATDHFNNMQASLNTDGLVFFHKDFELGWSETHAYSYTNRNGTRNATRTVSKVGYKATLDYNCPPTIDFEITGAIAPRTNPQNCKRCHSPNKITISDVSAFSDWFLLVDVTSPETAQEAKLVPAFFANFLIQNKVDLETTKMINDALQKAGMVIAFATFVANPTTLAFVFLSYEVASYSFNTYLDNATNCKALDDVEPGLCDALKTILTISDVAVGVLDMGGLGKVGADQMATVSKAAGNFENIAKNANNLGDGATYLTRVRDALWTSWEKYPKKTVDGQTLAQCADNLYLTRNAVDAMTPVGFGVGQSTTKALGIPPSVVDDVVENGAKVTGTGGTTTHTLNGITVVTKKGNKGEIIVESIGKVAGSVSEQIDELLELVDVSYRAALKADLEASTELLEALTKNPKLMDSWKKLDDLGFPPTARRNLNNLKQRSIIDEYAGNIANASNSRKGNFGEIGADLDLNSKGYESLQPRIDNIDTPGHNGIDGVYRKNGKYFIVEGKYTGSASLNPANPPNLPRQMSDDWIQRPGELANAIGDQQLAQTILNSDYKRVLAKVAPDGSVTYRLIDEEGYVIRGAAGDFNP